MQDHGRGRHEVFVAAETFDLFRHVRETMLKTVGKREKAEKMCADNNVYMKEFLSPPFFLTKSKTVKKI